MRIVVSAFLALQLGVGVALAQPDPTPPGDQPPVPVAPPQPEPTPPAPTPPPTPTPAPVTPPPAAPAPEPEREPTQAELIARANYEPSSVRLGGFLQAQYRKRQDAGGAFDADDTDGFRFARMRLAGIAQTRAGNLELSLYAEAELQPDFAMTDGYATVSRALPEHARITVDGGQMRVPISRQQMLSDSRLAYIDKAQLATIAPGRDLGAKVTFDAPRPDARRRELRIPGVRVIAGAFNGEGSNQVENINQRYLYAGRLELTVLGEAQTQLAESAFTGKYLTISGSAGLNRRSEANRLDEVTFLGFDVAGAYRGFSGEIEYLQAKHEQTVGGMKDSSAPDFKANGFVVQLNYLFPLPLPPLEQARAELGFRVEEIDRNDTIPIPAPADPAQSVRALTAVASYYLRMHTLKAQLAFTHFEELEDRTASGAKATFDNDQLLLQVTYRLE